MALPEPPVQGPDCGSMIARYGPKGLWLGRFSGGREVEYMFDQEGVETHTAEACFRNQAQCERWLYLLRSQFQMYPHYSECRRLSR